MVFAVALAYSVFVCVSYAVKTEKAIKNTQLYRNILMVIFAVAALLFIAAILIVVTFSVVSYGSRDIIESFYITSWFVYVFIFLIVLAPLSLFLCNNIILGVIKSNFLSDEIQEKLKDSQNFQIIKKFAVSLWTILIIMILLAYGLSIISPFI